MSEKSVTIHTKEWDRNYFGMGMCYVCLYILETFTEIHAAQVIKTCRYFRLDASKQTLPKNTC